MRVTVMAALAAGLAAAGCVPQEEGGDGDGALATPAGGALFAQYCAVCHGSGGRGDGPAAAGLPVRPTDLTRLTANNQGVYPFVGVMAKIYGYSALTGEAAGAMPEFGPLFEGDTVLIETAPGVMTPTPVRLVTLAEYIATLQIR
jgi:mono/diheme cytochrome c family protein